MKFLPSQKLESLKIKNTKDLFPFIKTKQDRQKFSNNSNIDLKKVTELTKLTDVSRIKYVGAKFARVLVDSDYNTVSKVAKADPRELLEEVNKINGEKNTIKENLELVT